VAPAAAVTLVGGDIDITGDISTSGSNAVAGAGGAAGAVSLNATDGTPTISLNGNITAQGGVGAGGAGGAGGAVTVNDPTTLGIDVTILTYGGTGTSTGAGGAVSFTAGGLATVDSDATPRDLTIHAGTSSVTFGQPWEAYRAARQLRDRRNTYLASSVTTADVAATDIPLHAGGQPDRRCDVDHQRAINDGRRRLPV
jgi:hypothetical protein